MLFSLTHILLLYLILNFLNLNKLRFKLKVFLFKKAEKEAQMVRTEAVKNEAMFHVYESYLDAELAQKQFDR